MKEALQRMNSVGHQSGPAEGGVDFPTLRGIWRLMARTDVRERVLQAGFALFSTKGFNATGVKDIVGRGGCAQRKFLCVFRKQGHAWLRSCLTAIGEEASDKLEQLVSSPGSPVERLKLHFRELSGELNHFEIPCRLFAGSVQCRNSRTKSSNARACVGCIRQMERWHRARCSGSGRSW